MDVNSPWTDRCRPPGTVKPRAVSAIPAVPLATVGIILLLAAAGPAEEGGREADLAAIRGRIAELENRLRGIRDRKEGLVGELLETDYELQLQGERLAEAQNRLGDARLALEVAQVETREVERRLDEVRSAVSRRVSGLYRLGGRGAVRLALSVEQSEDLLAALRSLRFLVRRDVELRRLLNQARAEMSRQLATLRARRRRVEDLVETETARLAEIRSLRRRRAALLSELEAREASLAEERRDWVERQSRLEDLLQAIAGGGESLAGRPIQDYRGVLDRPIVGSVIRPFGPRRDPRYKTLVPHNGLQFAGLDGEGVRVVYPGRVLYAEELEGYGETVIVLHPGRVFSLYAGLEGIDVEADELLSIGQEIGTAEGGLYFEIRVENRPVDPAEWIR